MHERFSGGRIIAICAALLPAGLAVSPVLLHKAHASNPLNLVYVTSNIGSVPNMNSVFAWANDGSGKLTPVSGSPYLTGGTGYYDPTNATFSNEADHELIISSATNRLFTVNANSNTVAVMNVNSDGSLTPVTGSPFASGGQEPLSLAISNGVLNSGLSVLTVDNMADDPNQVDTVADLNTLVIKTNGSLGTIPNSAVPLTVGSYLMNVDVTSPTTGDFVTSVQRGSSVSLPPIISMYHMSSRGVLSLAHTLTEPVGGALIGIAVNPISPLLYVGYPSAMAYDVVQYGATNGGLTLLHAIPARGDALCWLLVNNAGTVLYTVQYGSGTIAVYDITKASSPVVVQNFYLSGTHPTPSNPGFDTTGQFLYVITDQLLHVLNVSQTDGTLTETVSPVTIPVPTGEEPIGVASISE
jgi:6-phosphogluconolactonase (cycloisomerase 2 family)